MDAVRDRLEQEKLQLCARLAEIEVELLRRTRGFDDGSPPKPEVTVTPASTITVSGQSLLLR